MGVVPGVVVDEGGSVGETCDLIAVVPPTHDD
jgi:hypothetical protein